MLVSELARVTEPFRRLAGRAHLSPTYKCLELAATTIRGCSSYAALEAKADLSDIDDSVLHVDASQFLAVIGSLPSTAEFNMATSEGVLEWDTTLDNKKAGPRGRLALVSLGDTTMPKVKPPKGTPWVRDAKQARELRTVLEQGGLSCSNSSVNGNMYGVLLENSEGVLHVLSCDNTTLSRATIMEVVPAPDRMTLAPDSVALLLSLLSSGEDVELFFGPNDLSFRSAMFNCYIKAKDAMKIDIADTARKYEAYENCAELQRDNIKQFIKRVSALADSKRNVIVTLSAQSDAISLAFDQNTAASEETYELSTQLALDGEVSAKLDGTKLARALDGVQLVALDYVDNGGPGRNAVVFAGSLPVEFLYVVSAKE